MTFFSRKIPWEPLSQFQPNMSRGILEQRISNLILFWLKQSVLLLKELRMLNLVGQYSCILLTNDHEWLLQSSGPWWCLTNMSSWGTMYLCLEQQLLFFQCNAGQHQHRARRPGMGKQTLLLHWHAGYHVSHILLSLNSIKTVSCGFYL